MEQVQRIACVMHVLKVVSRKLFNLKEIHPISFGNLNEKFKEIVLNDVPPQSDLFIDCDSCEKAKQIIDYYLRIKKILAGYDPIKNKTFVENSSERHFFSVSVRSVQFIFSTDQKSSRKDHLENWNGDIDGWRKGKKEWMREKEKSLFVFNWKDSFFINFKNIISWCFKLIYLIQQNWKKNRFIWLVPTPIPTADIEQIKNYIRNHANDRILLSTLPSNVKRKYTKDQYLQILHDMETDGDGVVTSTENSTGPKAVVFIKKRRIESVNLDGNKDDRSADWRS